MGNDLRKLIKSLRDQGYIVEQTSKNHWTVRTSMGRKVTTLSSTPSDWRGWKNNISILRRDGFRWPPRR